MDLVGKLQKAADALATVVDTDWPELAVPRRGISLAFLRDYERSVSTHTGAKPPNSYRLVHGGDGDWRHFDAAAPDWWCTRALTQYGDRSLVQTLLLAAELTGDRTLLADADGNDYFGDATEFFSYCWKAELRAVFSCLERHQARRAQLAPAAPCFFWIDIFAVGQNQHTAAGKRENLAGVISPGR
jgi:hypothetical protein